MSEKNTILFTIPTLDGGGAERVFVNYIKSLNPDNWDIHLLLVDRTGIFLNLIPKYVKIHALGIKRTRYAFLKLLKNIKLINPDLIVSTLNRMNILVLIASFFISKQSKICLYEPSMPSAQFENRYLPRYYLWGMRLLYRRSDYIIAQTEEMKEEIKSFYSSPKKDIMVTINPIDTKYIEEQLIDMSNPYSSDYINVIVSGRIREEKGQDFLIKSFSEVVMENPQYKLYIMGKIGDPQFYESLLNIVEDNKLTDHVSFIEFKINPYPYYKYADLLVLPSRWEGLPNVVLETLYLQTPVIVTNCIPFFKRLINEGQNGYIVEFGDTSDLSHKILEYKKLTVEKDVLVLPDYDKIFKSYLIG